MFNKNIHVLNELIKFAEEKEAELIAASGTAEDPKLKSVFQSYAHECAHGAIELQAIVSSLGGTGAGSGTGTLPERGEAADDLGAQELSGQDCDRKALIAVERTQERAARAYRSALASDLDPAVSAIIEIQAAMVNRNHEDVVSLRQAIEACD